MKLKKILEMGLLSIGAFFINIVFVNAASAYISVSSSASSVTVGNTFTVSMTISSSSEIGSWSWTPDYSSNILSLISSDFEGIDTLSYNGQTSASYSYTFKAIASGSAYVSVKSYEAYAGDFTKFDLSAGTAYISSVSQADLVASYSKDNLLSALSVNGSVLSPDFNSSTNEYTAKVDSSVEKIIISATPNDNKASVSGTGELNVSEGENKFEIIVTAENGSKNTYIVTVIVEDPNPITVKTTDNKTLSVVKRASSLTKPEAFEAKTIKIKDIDIPSFYSDITKITLIGLKDDKGKINLYSYNEKENTYTIYNEIKFNNLTIYPMELKKDKKFTNYITKSIKINDIEVNVYKLKENSNYSIFYGINIENNEEGYYVYDKTNNSIISHSSEEVDLMNEKVFNYKKIIIILVGESIILLMIILFVSTNKRKKIRKLLNEIKKSKDIDFTKEKITEEINVKEKIEDLKKSKKKEKKKSLKKKLDDL